ncbi:hypothetical protein X975_05325, partial [Stegodyphus mimosarum]
FLRRTTGETTSSEAAETSSLSPSDPILGCSWTTLRLLEFFKKFVFRRGCPNVENQLPNLW